MVDLRYYAVATRRNIDKRRDSTWIAEDEVGVKLRFPTERRALGHARRACRDTADGSLVYPRAEIAA